MFSSPAEARKHNPRHHRRGCRTVKCDRRVDRAWALRHRPRLRLREALASWYGPADSGGSLACTGETLTSSTQGVANKTLPCGTRVRVCLDRSGPCVDVRVVDRGPYVEGRSFDLTEATARDIGFLSRGVGSVWVAVC